MKQLFTLLIITIFASCSLDDDINYHYELLPVHSVTLPTEFKRDSVYEIPFKYTRPSTCYGFENFYYYKEANIRTIAINAVVVEQTNCETPPINPVTVKLTFKPTTENSYIFKIWKGKDANGQSIFEQTEIPVVPND